MTNTNQTFRVALIGCGVIGNVHLSILSDMENVRLVAVCDTDEAALDAARATAKGAAFYTDYRRMIDEIKPDAVHICTPHYLHVPMAIYALDRGVNVFLEKPVGISMEEAEALLAAERRSKAKITVSFQNRFSPAAEEALRLAAEDGGALTGFCTVIWDRDATYYASGEWRGKRATEGGGALINQAIHSIDLLNYFLGTPKSVTATVSNHHLKKEIEVEDTGEGVITYENGKHGIFFATTAFSGKEDTTIAFETAHHKIVLKDGALFVDGALVVTKGSETIGKCEYGTGHPVLIDRFYRALAEGKEMPVSLESAVRTLAVVLASYRSHDTEIRL